MSPELAAWIWLAFLAGCAAYSYVACSIRERREEESARTTLDEAREPNTNETTRGIA